MKDAVTYRRVNRGYLAMTPEEAWQFISSRTKMTVAFPAPGGSPHVSTVWFCVRDRNVYFKGKEHKVKMGLAESGKASCLWEDGERFCDLRGAIVRGVSRIVVEPELRAEILGLLSDKYSALKPSVARSVDDREIVVEIRPERVSTWDNRKLPR